MIPHLELFQRVYVEEGGTHGSASSYATYLRWLDRACGGVDVFLKRTDVAALVSWCDRQPVSLFGSAKYASHVRSATRRYAHFMQRMPPDAIIRPLQEPPQQPVERIIDTPVDDAALASLLIEIRDIAGRYRKFTGKPLGVTGEVAEILAAQALDLELCGARTPGYDALDRSTEPARRIQVKGRAVSRHDRYHGRCPAIKTGGLFDDVLLVLLDQEDFSLLEIWKADEASVIARLKAPGSKARNERSSLAITQFRTIARKVWPAPQ